MMVQKKKGFQTHKKIKLICYRLGHEAEMTTTFYLSLGRALMVTPAPLGPRPKWLY